jgi:hypothetical protein
VRALAGTEPDERSIADEPVPGMPDPGEVGTAPMGGSPQRPSALVGVPVGVVRPSPRVCRGGDEDVGVTSPREG